MYFIKVKSLLLLFLGFQYYLMYFNTRKMEIFLCQGQISQKFLNSQFYLFIKIILIRVEDNIILQYGLLFEYWKLGLFNISVILR